MSREARADKVWLRLAAVNVVVSQGHLRDYLHRRRDAKRKVRRVALLYLMVALLPRTLSSDLRYPSQSCREGQVRGTGTLIRPSGSTSE